MSYGVFRLEAAVDWVELEIQLAERSNFWTVQDTLKAALQLPVDEKLYVNSLDRASGNAASIFRFRVQDPKQMRRIDQVLSHLRQCFIVSAVQVVAIEVAFDTYCQGASVRQLAEIAADRYRFLTSAPGNDWYFYRDQGEGRRYIKTLDHRRDLIQCFEEQWQLTDRNNKDVAIRYHAYVKTRDGNKKLFPKQYRARLEVTLQEAALTCSTLDTLERFDFASLAKLFKFRRFADDLHPAARHALTVWSKEQHGKRGKYRRPNRHMAGKYSGTSVFKCSTVADDDLNEAAYESLRKLTRDWRSQRLSADFPEHFEPQTRTDAGNR